MQKKCNSCKIMKELNNEIFFRKKSSSDGYGGKCKPCQKEYQVKHYAANKEKIYTRNITRRRFLAQEVDKLKDFPCIDCGIKYEPFCMDFDHLSDKVMVISKMVHETFSLENIKKEIAKCELVCVLCHKNRTYFRLKSIPREPAYPCYIRNRLIIATAKNTPCVVCNIQYNSWQMEFDHLVDKEISVGLMQGNSQQKLENEINKCQVLCALCHRRKTKETLW